ncbi:hypothetical protein KR51_00026690 [Rubidibacter lacunae KORDI 51-2]|uniref:Nitrate reductase associated protein n=1 Tax=Rubidibacter lacunae KORDI 51-2 TaxID=582515 RepID=U5DJD6_9CHRO|nr:nitrate reductase associated protein [Rubidibacter lacunae]ERN40684.1 hypothetical protein KR51_00026690 [Rubidibacter lacunae KORDI 51-2]
MPPANNDATFFHFESDFVGSLRCIPMQVRYKLDTCGVKLKLQHWNQFDARERQTFVELPCTTPEDTAAYRDRLQNAVATYTGTPAKEVDIDPHPPWLQADVVPPLVRKKARDFNADVAPEQWVGLTPLQRFALIKLSRPSHENKNFYLALQEFGLAAGDLATDNATGDRLSPTESDGIC